MIIELPEGIIAIVLTYIIPAYRHSTKKIRRTCASFRAVSKMWRNVLDEHVKEISISRRKQQLSIMLRETILPRFISRCCALINLEIDGLSVYDIHNMLLHVVQAVLLHITTLQLYSCSVFGDSVQLSCLEKLKSLRTLCLYNCYGLSDLSALHSLASLSQLQIIYAKSLHDITPLSAMTTLVNLRLAYCDQLRNVYPLLSLFQLSTLYLDNNEKLANINIVSQLLQLKYLDISWCQNIIGISKLKNLTGLHIVTEGTCFSSDDEDDHANSHVNEDDNNTSSDVEGPISYSDEFL